MVDITTEQRPSGTQIAFRAWRSAFGALLHMPLLFLSAAALFAIMALAESRWLPSALDVGNARSSGGPILPGYFWLTSILIVIVRSILAAPVAVATHRFVLLDQTTKGLISFSASRIWHFIAWLLALNVLAMSGGLFVSFVRPNSGTLLLSSVSLLVLGLLAFIVSIRLSLIFPAVAVDAGDSGWQASLARSKGHFWWIFRALFMAFLLPGLLGIALEIFLLRQAIGNPQRLSDLVTQWPYLVGSAVIAPFFVALAAAVASWIYAWITRPRSAFPLA